jgi:hypothetical protein
MSSSAVETVFRKVERVLQSEIKTKQTQVTVNEDDDAQILDGVELDIEALSTHTNKMKGLTRTSSFKHKHHQLKDYQK